MLAVVKGSSRPMTAIESKKQRGSKGNAMVNVDYKVTVIIKL